MYSSWRDDSASCFFGESEYVFKYKQRVVRRRARINDNAVVVEEDLIYRDFAERPGLQADSLLEVDIS
jgi:nuclear transport factor 2 (NTF2) superfamily protein